MNRTSNLKYLCIECGEPTRHLSKRFSNSTKVTHCEKCHRIADKYIEFEPIIILIDGVVASAQNYRHIIYNSDFKLHWKLSLVLFFLESFGLWRQKHDGSVGSPDNEWLEMKDGFYLCCLINIADYSITLLLLFISTLVQRKLTASNIPTFCLNLMKAVAIANFSKLFLLPILVWRENTTEFCTTIHHVLVMCHYLFSLIFTYDVVNQQGKMNTALTVLPTILIKQYMKWNISLYIVNNIKRT